VRRQRRALDDALGREEAERIEAVRSRRGGRLLHQAPRKAKPVACKDFVEQVTAYLEDELPRDVRRSIDRHLEACVDCARTVAQWRQVVALTGRLGEDEVDRVDPATRTELLNAFRAEPPTAPD
jgi:Putative zinc-finger